MALLVWLPLNGNLDNLGLILLPNPSINSMNFSDSGKISSLCGKNIVGWHLTSEILDNQWSIATWINSPNTFGINNNIIFCKNISNSTDCLIYLSIINNKTLNLGVNGPSSSILYSYTFDLNTWYHIAATYDGNTASLYLNGQLVKTGIVTTAFPSGRLNIQIDGRSTNTNNTSSTGSLGIRYNDFRLYDHYLSPKEVHEIAKGLVLHYKLDEGSFNVNKNLLTSEDLTTWSKESSVTCTWDSTVNMYKIADSSHTSSRWGIYKNITLKANTTYTFSVEGMKVDQNVGYGFSEGTSSWPAVAGLFTTTKSRNSKTITIGLSDAICRIYLFIYPVSEGTNYGYFVAPKLEYGATMTVPSSTIYDCSGYNNNGKLYSYDSEGSINVISDSPRYDRSIFLNSSAVNNAASGTVYIYGHCVLTTPNLMSVAFWCKPTANGYGNTTGQGLFCTTNYAYNNVNAGTDYYLSAMNHRDSTVDINDSEDQSASTLCRLSFVPTLGEWHHYTITYDGLTGRIYKDGVETQNKSFDSPKSLASFIGVIIGFSKAGGVWRRNKSCFSDFRVYATCLSQPDILELYNTSALIDNKGDLFGYLFNELRYNIVYDANYGIISKQYIGGLSSYTLANCLCTLTDTGYRIYRPANLTVANDGNTMWGGLVLSNTNNLYNFKDGHSYILEFDVKGQSSNAAGSGWSNNVGWGGGGLTPNPTNIICNNPVDSNFNSSEWKHYFYKWTISDGVYKVCTSSYSGFVEGNTYVSYRGFKFGFIYTSTGTLGTDLYIKNLTLYDITDNTNIDISKTGIINTGNFVEEYNESKFLFNNAINSNQLIEI